MNVTFFKELLGSIAERGRAIIESSAERPPAPESLESLCRSLLSTRGEASGTALASAIVTAYAALDEGGRLAFFELLKDAFGPDRERLEAAAAR